VRSQHGTRHGLDKRISVRLLPLPALQPAPELHALGPFLAQVLQRDADIDCGERRQVHAGHPGYLRHHRSCERPEQHGTVSLPEATVILRVKFARAPEYTGGPSLDCAHRSGPEAVLDSDCEEGYEPGQLITILGLKARRERWAIWPLSVGSHKRCVIEVGIPHLVRERGYFLGRRFRWADRWRGR